MRVLTIAAVMMALASPAVAQVPNLGFPMGGEKTLSPEERERQEAQDKAYKESLKKIPNQTAPNDPWGSARAAEQKAPAKSKTEPKAAPASQKKAGGAAN